MNDLAQTHSIVIVGGGFAGTALARALAAWRTPGLQVTLISDESTTTFNPMLPEAVGASVFPEQVVAPLREMLDLKRGDCFVMGRVTDVDTRERTLRCHTLVGDLRLHYDQLVLAFGNRARLDLIPGMALHAMPLKTVGDALHIRNVVLRRLARIELEHDADLRREIGHFVVIGGGFSGVEVAGELVDCLASIRRFYPRVRHDELKVTLLHDMDRLLPEMSSRLAAAALRSLVRRGVAVELNARATSIHERGVMLADGRFARGTERDLDHRHAAQQPHQRVGPGHRAGPHDRRAGSVGAGAPRRLGARRLRAGAERARRQGVTADGAVCGAASQVLAGNLLAHQRGEPTRRFAARPLGMMAAIGRHNGVAEVLGIGFSGLPAWLLWRAYYLSQMPTLRRKLRIWVEWTWGMFFPADITHLRFTRSADLPAHERGTGV